MTTDMRLGASIVLILMIAGVLCVNPKVDNSGGDDFWIGGKRDPARNLLMREDGTLRPFTKPLLLALLVAVLVVVWIAEPAA